MLITFIEWIKHMVFIKVNYIAQQKQNYQMETGHRSFAKLRNKRTCRDNINKKTFTRNPADLASKKKRKQTKAKLRNNFTPYVLMSPLGVY